MGSGSQPAHGGWAHNHLKIQFLFWLLWARTHVVNVNLHRHTHMHKKFLKKKRKKNIKSQRYGSVGKELAVANLEACVWSPAPIGKERPES